MRAILTFQGFRESARARTGTEDLYWTVIRSFANGEITSAWPMNWTADVKSTANQLARQGISEVAIVSYSHGQAAATSFAEYAYSVGITVSLWLACDPVYRAPKLPRWNILQPLSAWSLTKWATIKVPRNIRRAVYVRQKLIIPRGHELIAEDSVRTTVVDAGFLPYSHTSIDSSGPWQDLVHAELTDWARPPIAIPVL